MVYEVITFSELENNSSIIGVHGEYCDSKNVRLEEQYASLYLLAGNKISTSIFDHFFLVSFECK